MSKSIDLKVLKEKRTSGQQPAAVSDGEKEKDNIFTRDIVLLSNLFPDKAKELFYAELGTLLEAGLDIKASLDLVKKEQRKKSVAGILQKIDTKVTNGSSLSSALQAETCFTAYEYFSVQIGEETGKLVEVLLQLSLYYKKKISQRRQVVSALTYPCIVLLVAFSAIFFMMNYVVPMFSDVFKRFGGQLPFITRCIVDFSSFIKQHAGTGALLSVVVTGCIIAFRKKPWYKKMMSSFVLKIPVVKDLVLKVYLSRFSATLSLLTGARVPLLQAIGLTRQMIGFYPLTAALIQMEEDIVKGLPFYECLEQHKLFPPRMVALIRVGEEVNQLPLFFDKITTQYSNDIEYQTGLLSKLIEPAIILILGVVVGVVLIAMYLPLFNMGETIK